MTHNPRNCPGPGDEITWPSYSGHPNDPRAPDDDRPWEELLDDERRALLLDEYSLEEVIELYLDECHNTERLEREIKRLERIAK